MVMTNAVSSLTWLVNEQHLLTLDLVIMSGRNIAVSVACWSLCCGVIRVTLKQCRVQGNALELAIKFISVCHAIIVGVTGSIALGFVPELQNDMLHGKWHVLRDYIVPLSLGCAP